MPYAEGTSVYVERTVAEINSLLIRHRATGFMHGWTTNRAFIAFEMESRRIKFMLPLPDPQDRKFWRSPKRHYQRTPDEAHRAWEQACRSRWHALFITIKAKLESIATGIECFDDAFMPHIVMPDGRTVGEHIRPTIAIAYEQHQMPPLLPDYSHSQPKGNP